MLDILTTTTLLIVTWLGCGFLHLLTRAILNSTQPYDSDADYTEVDDDEVIGAAILGPCVFLLVGWYFVTTRLWPWLRTNARLAWRGARRFWA